MQFVSDPSISIKIDRMKRRVRWQDPVIHDQCIDQTRLFLNPSVDESQPFSFLVIGDSGNGHHRGDSPQRRVAKWLMANGEDSHCILHTGDLVYLVGSRHYYPSNFIVPYREWLVGGDDPKRIRYDQMVFKRPFLPVPGNHDYYDVPPMYGALSLLFKPLRWLLRRQVDLDYGWQGSHQGEVYARAFLDYLCERRSPHLAEHLHQHYRATVDTGNCLMYEPGKFTRLPNRYYMFRQGGIDFFALDSNTFNSPLSAAESPQGAKKRQQLLEQRQRLVQEKETVGQQSLGQQSLAHSPKTHPDDARQDAYAKLEQLDEQIQDIDKQLATLTRPDAVDWEQLHWLEQRLIASWQNESVRGRVVYFHHPPYVTEASKWDQGQTLAIRYRLRQVLDAVQTAIKRQPFRPIVDLVISGHAHCIEYLQTLETGHADSHMHWLICGGSGFSLRRQRPEGNTLTEDVNGEPYPIAQSKVFIGRSGHGRHKRRPYSGLKIEVHPGRPLRFTVHPHVVEQHQRQWSTQVLDPIDIAVDKTCGV